MHRQDADDAQRGRARARPPRGRRRPARPAAGRRAASAASTKYEAAPTIAISAQSTPTGARSAPDSRSRTRTRPSAARPAPATVSGPGRSPWRSHSHDDHRGGRGVLDQQRRPDVHPLRRPRSSANCAPATGTAPNSRTSRGVARAARPSGRAARGRRTARRRARRCARRARTTAPGDPAGVEQPAGQRRRRARTPSPRRPRAASPARMPTAPRCHWSSPPWPMTIGGVRKMSTCCSPMTQRRRCGPRSRSSTAPRSRTRSPTSSSSTRGTPSTASPAGATRDAAELDALRALRPVLRELLTADRDRAAELVNALLAEARALPQLRRHDGLDWHIHAVPADAPLDRRVAVETAMAMIDVIRADELSRLVGLRRRPLRGPRARPLAQPLAPLLQHDVREPQRGRRLPRARPRQRGQLSRTAVDGGPPRR